MSRPVEYGRLGEASRYGQKSCSEEGTREKEPRAEKASAKSRLFVAKATQPVKKREAHTPALDAEKLPAKKVDQKAITELLVKGKKQGYLTYEINEILPEDMLSPDQIDETLMPFDDNGIEVVDEKQNKKLVKTVKALAESKTVSEDIDATDYGAVTDPVKMYLLKWAWSPCSAVKARWRSKKIEAGESRKCCGKRC